jgi:DNA-binding CsgD family transcriptional regulator
MRNGFATIVVEPSVFTQEGLVRVLGAAQFRIIASADCVEDLVLASLPQHRSMLLIIGAGENPRAAIRQIELFREWHPPGVSPFWVAVGTREKCVLRYLVEGHSSKLIALKIDVAEATVKVHVKAILRKIQVLNRTQAAMWAINHGSIISAIDSASQDRRASRPARLFGHNGGSIR